MGARLLPNGGWIRQIDVRPKAKVRLFCFPYSGGRASEYQTWRYDLTDIEIASIEYPGHGDRIAEQLSTDITTLVAGAAEAILNLSEKPFAFFGHSMGGIVAFEIARYLRRSYSKGPTHLVISSSGVPGAFSIAENDLSDDALAHVLRRYNGTPEAVLRDKELTSLLFPILRADFTMMSNYTPSCEDRLTCPLAYFFGESDGPARAGVEAWAQLTSSFTSKMFPGDHFYFRTQKGPLLHAIRSFLLDDMP